MIVRGVTCIESLQSTRVESQKLDQNMRRFNTRAVFCSFIRNLHTLNSATLVFSLFCAVGWNSKCDVSNREVRLLCRLTRISRFNVT